MTAPQLFRNLAVVLIGSLWVGSLFLPTMETGGEPWDHGWFILVIAWMGLFNGYMDWFANPVLLATLFLVGRGIYSEFAFLSSFLFLTYVVILSLVRTEIADNEGGVMILITGYFLGFYLWIAACSLGALLALVSYGKPSLLGLKAKPSSSTN